MIFGIVIKNKLLKKPIRFNNQKANWSVGGIIETFNDLYKNNNINVELNEDNWHNYLHVINWGGESDSFQAIIDLSNKDLSDIVNLGNDLDIFDNFADMFNQIDDKYSTNAPDTHTFDESFYKSYFNNPYEAARATYFGKVNWTDNYAYINNIGNIVTIDELNYDDYATDILKVWLKENGY